MCFLDRTFGKKRKKSSVEKRTVIVVVLCNGLYQKKPAKVVREEEDEEDEEDDVSREGVSFLCLAPFFSRKKERERENATNLEREKKNALV